MMPFNDNSLSIDSRLSIPESKDKEICPPGNEKEGSLNYAQKEILRSGSGSGSESICSTYDLIQFLVTCQPEDLGIKLSDFPYQLKKDGHVTDMDKSILMNIFKREKSSRSIKRKNSTGFIYAHHLEISTDSLNLTIRHLRGSSMGDDPFLKHLDWIDSHEAGANSKTNSRFSREDFL